MRKVILFTLCIFFSLYSCVDDEDFVIENLSSQDLVACIYLSDTSSLNKKEPIKNAIYKAIPAQSSIIIGTSEYGSYLRLFGNRVIVISFIDRETFDILSSSQERLQDNITSLYQYILSKTEMEKMRWKIAYPPKAK